MTPEPIPLAATYLREIPPKFHKHCLSQDYAEYSQEDHKVWEFATASLLQFQDGHKDKIYGSYFRALRELDLSPRRIPRIEEISERLAPLGWRAVCIDGYISPVTYVQMQAAKLLAVSRRIRSKEDMAYSPFPDVVHDVYGHLPILMDLNYRSLLTYCSEIAVDLGAAFDEGRAHIAPNPLTKRSQSWCPAPLPQHREIWSIQQCMSHKRSLFNALYRLSFWVLEFGLLGTARNYQIIGAGLLSSVSESAHVFSGRAKILPFDRRAAQYEFNISDFQEQVFVSPSLEQCREVVADLIKRPSEDFVGSVGEAVPTETQNG
jgi:phenylalanine-4-hydroxylase